MQVETIRRPQWISLCQLINIAVFFFLLWLEVEHMTCCETVHFHAWPSTYSSFFMSGVASCCHAAAKKKEQPLKRNTIKTGHFFEVIDVKEHYIKSCIIHILTRDPEINSTLFHLTRCWYIFELGLCQGITFSLLFFSSISMPSSVVYNAQAFHFSSNFIGCP